MTGRDVAARRSPSSQLEAFERVYLRNVHVLMGYFARRCREPQTVDDLTSETFVRAAEGFARFDPRRGSDRAWLFGIATRVFARHCERTASGRDAVARLRGDRSLDQDEIEELLERIDAEREGAALMRRCAELPAAERAAIELVDIEQLSPKEAALALGVPRVAFRKRLSRARSRLRAGSTPSAPTVAAPRHRGGGVVCRARREMTVSTARVTAASANSGG